MILRFAYQFLTSLKHTMTGLNNSRNKLMGLLEKYSAFIMGAILLLTLAMRFAEPVRDGDLFFHIKYGEYLLENRTLIPDHSIYSWTPADNSKIYCTWISDIILYAIDRSGGLPLFFALRYLCMFALVFVVWEYARRMGQGRDTFTFLILVIVLLASYSAAFLDPDIVSALFMALVSGIFFSVKASLWEKWGTRPLLFLPFVFLLWVNIHGVFFFGLVFLGLITLGEILNYRLRPQDALSSQGMRHLLTGAVLSAASTFVTPYGCALHLKLYDKCLNLLMGTKDLGTSMVEAYQPIFALRFSELHYVEFWVIMLFCFGILFSFLAAKKGAWDWAILLPTVFLAVIYASYVRATFYWPVFWGMSLIYLRKRAHVHLRETIGKARQVFVSGFKWGIIILFLFLSARAMHNAYFNPLAKLRFGFGIGYQNPVQASAFLKEYREGKTLYNSYDVGGYLIYDLFPVYKVFIDPRYFPYQDWFAEYYSFNCGAESLDEFTKKYPIDIALVDYLTSKMAITKFLLSEEWEPVFYGPSAVVFAKKDVNFSHDIKSLDKRRFDDLGNLYQAFNVFLMALQLEDVDTADYVLELIKRAFSERTHYFKPFVNMCELYRDGLTAYAKKDYETALKNLATLGFRPFSGPTNVMLARLLNWKAKQLVQEREYKRALGVIEWVLQATPNYAGGLFNAGILSYWVEVIEDQEMSGDDAGDKSQNDNPLKWKAYFEQFLTLAPNHEKAPIVRRALEGKGLPPRVRLIL